jgi:hypothetical protein
MEKYFLINSVRFASNALTNSYRFFVFHNLQGLHDECWISGVRVQHLIFNIYCIFYEWVNKK